MMELKFCFAKRVEIHIQTAPMPGQEMQEGREDSRDLTMFPMDLLIVAILACVSRCATTALR